MPSWDALRPPPPRSAPIRPARSRRWIWIGALGLAVAAVPGSLIFLRTRSESFQRPEVTADQFVRALVAASGRDPAGSGRTGFEAAYALLSDAKRRALPFDVFFEEWSRLFESKGFVVDHVRTTELPMRARLSQEIEHLLFLGGESQDHASLETVNLTLKLNWVRDASRYVVSDFHQAATANPRATR